MRLVEMSLISCITSLITFDSWSGRRSPMSFVTDVCAWGQQLKYQTSTALPNVIFQNGEQLIIAFQR